MTAPVAGVPSLNPLTAGIPGYALQQIQAQRRLQLAQALTQQGMAPIDYDPKGHISWTQGLAKALQAYAGGAMFNKGAQQQADLQTQGMQAMGLAYGFGGQLQPAVSPPSGAIDPRAAAALNQGAQQGSIGPTNANAAAMGSMPPPAASAPPQTQQQGSPLNPYGAPPMLAYLASQGDPGALEQMKTFLANKTLTDQQRNAQDPTIGAATVSNLQTQNMTPLQKLQVARAHVPDGSVMAQQIDAAIAKENYIAPIEVKAGNLTMTPDGKNPLAYNPGFDKGINPSWSTNAQGYTTASGAAPVPGYASANASIVAADQRAKTDNTIQTATGPDGATLTGRGADVFPASDGVGIGDGSRPGDQLAILRQERVKPTNTPEDNAALDREIARAGGGAAGVITGPSLTDKPIMKAGGDVVANAPAQVAASKAAITGLTQALNIVEGGQKTGAGQMRTVNALALLNNLGVPLGKGDVDGYQTLQKYLANSLNAAAQGTGASGSDARFDSFMHGQPNADTMNAPALSSALRYVLSQHDAAAARGNFITQAYQQAKASGDPNAALTAQQQWAKVYNPEDFRIGRLAPADQVKAVNSMSPADAKAFMQRRQLMGQFQ